MSVKIHKDTIKTEHFSFNTFSFIPEKEAQKSDRNIHAVFAHGYTASKSSLLNWAQRLSENGIPTCIMDLPGHFLGSFNEVESFEVFTENAHKNFCEGRKLLESYTGQKTEKLILGGHSLGALLSMMALELDELSEFTPMAIGVGIGISQVKGTHLFDSAFYEKTLNVRRQLVHSSLDSDLMFPWIKKKKENLEISGHRIHMITGADDMVVGSGGIQKLEEKLSRLGNHVSIQEPAKLAHHTPEVAASYIYSFLKKELSLS